MANRYRTHFGNLSKDTDSHSGLMGVNLRGDALQRYRQMRTKVRKEILNGNRTPLSATDPYWQYSKD